MNVTADEIEKAAKILSILFPKKKSRGMAIRWEELQPWERGRYLQKAETFLYTISNKHLMNIIVTPTR